MQTQLSASPVKTPVHKEQPGGDHGRLTPPYSYSCASPSKASRASPNQGAPSAPPPTFTSVRRLFKDPLTLSQGMTLTNSSVLYQPGDTGQAQLDALGELECWRQFLILNYAGGNKLEKVLGPETIRSWKDLPMQLFELWVSTISTRKTDNG